MKKFSYSKQKDEWLKKTRNISFEDVIGLLEEDQIIANIDNPKKPNQKLFIVQIKSYTYVIPYVETEEETFLKTIYPSRKYRKKYT